MFWSRAFALLALVALVESAPLSKVDAEGAQARLKKLHTFTDAFYTNRADQSIITCKAASTTFANKCASNSSITCKGTKAGTCTTCKAGSKVLQSGIHSQGSCESTGVCTINNQATVANSAGECKDGCFTVDNMISDGVTQNQCTGSCPTSPGHKNKSACEGAWHKWTTLTWHKSSWQAGKWTTLASQDSKAKCGKDDKCMQCQGCGSSCPGDAGRCATSGQCNITVNGMMGASPCKNGGGKWTPAKWAEVAGKTKDDCSSGGRRLSGMGAATWDMKANFMKGDEWETKGSLCCDGGQKKCGKKENGDDIKGLPLGSCCEWCINKDLKNASNAGYAKWCSAAGQKENGATVCGTKAGTCTTCKVGSKVLQSGIHSQGSCESTGVCTINNQATMARSAGMCKDGCFTVDNMLSHGVTQNQCTGSCPTSPGHKNKSACEGAKSKWEVRTWHKSSWQAGKWTTLASQDSKAKCGKDDKCMQCQGCGSSCPGDAGSCATSGQCNITVTGMGASPCKNGGGKWTPAKWAEVAGKTKDDCSSGGKVKNMGSATWDTKANFKEGEQLKPAGVTSCTTGPTHSEPSHLVPKDVCLSQDLFLADALAGKTAASAMSGNATYYKSAESMVLGGAKVVNHASAKMRSEFTLLPATCFLIVANAQNHGKFTLNGASKTFVLVLDPTNYADADDLLIKGGSATVLGGSNAGNLVSTTTGRFEVYGLVNSGNVAVSGASSVVLADVQNKGGKVTVTNMPSVTLINVQSSGSIIADGANGNYKGYGIVNSGTVTINAGIIDLHFKCNTGGNVTIGKSVTGKISYDGAGCKGTMSVPAAVKLTELAGPTTTTAAGGKSTTPMVAAKKVSGQLKIKVPAASAATFKTNPKVKIALQEAIAGQIAGVEKQMVKILEVIDARRLSASHRLLSNATNHTTIKVKYEITLPKDMTVSTVTTAMTGSTAKTSLATLVNKELKKQNINATITVEETTAVEIVPTATSAPKAAANFAQLSNMFDTVVLMGMIGAHFLL